MPESPSMRLFRAIWLTPDFPIPWKSPEMPEGRAINLAQQLNRRRKQYIKEQGMTEDQVRNLIPWVASHSEHMGHHFVEVAMPTGRTNSRTTEFLHALADSLIPPRPQDATPQDTQPQDQPATLDKQDETLKKHGYW